MLKKGLIWDFVGKLFNQGITFFVSIFLARLLLPEDFALIAMVMGFIGIARIFVDFGLSQALIQSQNTTDIHYSSIFWLNLFFAIFISILFFLSAPSIAFFYHQPDIINLAKVLSITFAIGALGSVHIAMLKKKMDFKYLSITNIISATLSGCIGIYMAFNNYGVWSIVVQQISAAAIRLFLLWYGTRWLPLFKFSWSAIKPLWNFSKKLFISGLLETVAQQLDVFIIGKLFMPATLGFYSRGKSLNQLIANYSASSLSSVLFPALSKIQNNLAEVKQKVIAFFRLATLTSFFLGGLLFIIAEDLIVLMFTEKWLPTVPYFRIMVLTTFAYPVSVILLTPLTSLGRSDIFLKLEIIKKIILVPTYIIGFQFGLTGFLYAQLISHIIGISLNGYYTGKLIHWKLSKQWVELLTYGLPAYLGAGLLFIYLPQSSIQNHFLHLLISGIIFTIYYTIFNLLFKTTGMQLILNLVQTFYKKMRLKNKKNL